MNETLAALVTRHQAETAALPMNPARDVILNHATRQALELFTFARTLERERDALERSIQSAFASLSHNWTEFGPEHCVKCGQSFTAYAFMEAP